MKKYGEKKKEIQKQVLKDQLLKDIFLMHIPPHLLRQLLDASVWKHFGGFIAARCKYRPVYSSYVSKMKSTVFQSYAMSDLSPHS